LSQFTRVTDGRTDRQTDGQTDRILIARPRLHYMQRGNNETLYKSCNNNNNNNNDNNIALQRGNAVAFLATFDAV